MNNNVSALVYVYSFSSWYRDDDASTSESVSFETESVLAVLIHEENCMPRQGAQVEIDCTYMTSAVLENDGRATGGLESASNTPVPKKSHTSLLTIQSHTLPKMTYWSLLVFLTQG